MTCEIEDSEGLEGICSSVPENWSMVNERPIGYFETRVDWRMQEQDWNSWKTLSWIVLEVVIICSGTLTENHTLEEDEEL